VRIRAPAHLRHLRRAAFTDAAARLDKQWAAYLAKLPPREVEP
jgi:hypothetical protein